MSIKENIDTVKRRIYKAALASKRDPHDISLVAVTKGVAYDKILDVVDAGVTIIGENRVQELLDKYDKVERNIRWHLIGSLQTNKVKYIIDKVELIHSLDRISLAHEINKRAEIIGRKVQVLVQVNVSREKSKSGIYEEELLPFIEELKNYPNIMVKGLMTIGPLTNDVETIRACFRRCRQLFETIRDNKINHIDMEILSMGMSNDFEIAIEEGANMVRIGRVLFKS